MRFSFPLALLFLMAFVHFADAKPTPSSDRLTRAAQMLYLPNAFLNFDYDEDYKIMEKGRKKVTDAARAALQEVAPETLRKHFQARLRYARFGSWEESSISYVLALRGIDTLRNARRMTNSWKVNGFAPNFYYNDGLGGSLAEIYRAHPSDALMRLFLTLRGDGLGQAGLDLERQEMLLRSSRAVLRVAADDTAILNELAQNMTYENWAEAPIARRINATLKAAQRHYPQREAAAARYLLRRIARERIGEAKPEPTTR